MTLARAVAVKSIRSAMDNSQQQQFYAGGFLFNPKTCSVLLHLRDDKTPIHPNQWGFFGGLNEGPESPTECFLREFKEETGVTLNGEEVQPVCNYLNQKHKTWRYVFFC